MGFQKLLLLDDDAHGKVKKFIKNGGLKYLKARFAVSEAYAMVGEKKPLEFNLYNEKFKNMASLPVPTQEDFPEEIAEIILKKIAEKDDNILVLCDWEWKVDTTDGQLTDSFEKIVSAFEKNYPKKLYSKIVMIFYTTLLDRSAKIPNGRGEIIIIKQKSVMGWRWEDVTSSVMRAKDFLSECKFDN